MELAFDLAIADHPDGGAVTDDNRILFRTRRDQRGRSLRPMLRLYISTSILRSVKALRARLFRNGGSQAVRLPHEVRFPEGKNEVSVRREGRRVILEPADEWTDAFRACLGAWPHPIQRPPQKRVGKLRDPFR